MTPVAIVPVRSFRGMARLSPVLDDRARGDLLRRLAATALAAVEAAGMDAVVVTGDDDVAAWSGDAGACIVSDPGAGLDAAAAAGVAAAAGRPWMVVHGDLPAVTGPDLLAVRDAIGDRPVLAPSKDGGTSVVAWNREAFPFHFGPGSFRRHLAALSGSAVIVVRPGLAIDIDRPEDLAAWSRRTLP